MTQVFHISPINYYPYFKLPTKTTLHCMLALGGYSVYAHHHRYKKSLTCSTSPIYCKQMVFCVVGFSTEIDSHTMGPFYLRSLSFKIAGVVISSRSRLCFGGDRLLISFQ